MPISLDEAMSSYGFVYQLANQVPELKTFLDQAVQNSWTADKLTAMVESSAWWMQNADTVRNLAIQQATEPGTYAQNLAFAKNQIGLKARQQGRYYTDADLNTLALITLTSNASWDDGVLSELVASRLGIRGNQTDGIREGTAAQYQDHFTKVAQDYGVAYSQDFLDSWVTKVQMGFDTADGFESLMRSRAKAAFPQFANQIDAGMTVRDIADPYISTYAKTLEVPETDVKLQDTAIQRALSQTGQDGTTRTSMPLWQFERTLKDDPRYDSTKQAKSDAFSTLAKIGSDWGFVGKGA